MLKGKTVILGISGSIAAYKMASLASMLAKQHCDVQVIMTKNATEFITPLTFEELTGNKCMVDTFDRNFSYNVAHISLAQKADYMLIAPASANVIGKLSYGIADDMLTTTALACNCKKVIAPAMNTNMYENPVVQDNLKRLKGYGYEVIDPVTGMLACKTVGTGKLPEPQVLYEYILRELALPHDMIGKKVLITAGATKEAIDPVRYITNHATGKMGYALAKMCMLRGAEVTLVSGESQTIPPMFVDVIWVSSAAQMFDEVTRRGENQDMIFKAAAVADYTPLVVSHEKIKKKADDYAISFKRTQDILMYLAEHKKKGQMICGFSMETENMIENSKAKLVKKNLDMIAANNLKVRGAGFGVDTNVMTLITKNQVEALPLMTKEEVSNIIITKVLGMWNKENDG